MAALKFYRPLRRMLQAGFSKQARPGALILCAALLLSTLHCARQYSDRAAPQARQGVLDLREWDFERDGPIALKGEWEFYKNLLLVPGELAQAPRAAAPGPQFADAPGGWEAEQGHGYATYRLTLLLPADRPALVADNLEAGTAYALYWNERLIARNGRVGANPDAHVPRTLPLTYNIPAELLASDTPTLTLQVSNFDARAGGIHRPLILGQAGHIAAERSGARTTEAFLLGALLIMGVYHLTIWLQRRRESASFWFGVCCLTTVVRLLVTGTRSFQSTFPDAPFLLYYKLEYLSFYAAVPIFTIFIARLLPRQVQPAVLRVIVWFAAPLCAAVIVSPAHWFTRTLQLYQIFSVATGCYMMYVFIRAVIDREMGARVLLSGFVVLFAAAINDMAGSYIPGMTYLIPAGLFVFVFSQAWALSRRIARAFNSTEEFSAKLEDKVQRRTAALQEARTLAEKTREEIERLNEFSRRINEHGDLDRIVTDISRFAVESLQMRGVILVRVDEERGEFQAAGGYFTDATPEQAEFLRSARAPLQRESGFLYLVYAYGKTAYWRGIKRKLKNKFDIEMQNMLGITAFVGIPLLVRGKVRGVMGYSPGERPLSKNDLARLEAYVDQIAGAVYTAGLLKKVDAERAMAEQLRRESEQLNQLMKRVARLDDIEAIMNIVQEFLKEVCNLHYYSLYSVDAERMQIHFVSAIPPDWISPEVISRVKNTPIRLDHPTGAFARAFRRRKLTNYTRLSPQHAEETEQFIISAWRLKNFVVCPLIVDDELYAFLSFTSYETRGLSRQQLNWLSILSEQIAGVVRANKLMIALKKEQARAEAALKESDRLLANVLPDAVAEELKREGEVAPQFYESISVLFTDFVGFTEASQKMAPQELVRELDGCFSQFDAVIRRNNLEKLKTIGDAYMCAGGLPKANATHAIDACLAALELRAFMTQMAEVKTALGHDSWRIRIGIHSGPATAGVIGTNKFAYDIWGDTVNTASRMESAGGADRINVSQATYDLVKDLFEFEYRGRVAAKGKGELDMYFLNRIRPELSIDADGHAPNARFELLRAGRDAGAPGAARATESAVAGGRSLK